MIIESVKANNPVKVYGDGKNIRDWIHVQDHCEALFQIFNKGKIGKSYNVGSNQNIKNKDIAKKLLKLLKKKSVKIRKETKIKFVKDRPGHDFRYALNSNKIRKELKWKTKIRLDQGLADTFDWYLENMDFFTSVSKKLYNRRLGLK